MKHYSFGINPMIKKYKLTIKFNRISEEITTYIQSNSKMKVWLTAFKIIDNKFICNNLRINIKEVLK